MQDKFLHADRYIHGSPSLTFFHKAKSPSQIQKPMKQCNICFNPGSFQCGKCLKTKYCSKECQKLDWKTHKEICHSPRGFIDVESIPDYNSPVRNARPISQNFTKLNDPDTMKPQIHEFTGFNNPDYLSKSTILLGKSVESKSKKIHNLINESKLTKEQLNMLVFDPAK